MLRTRRVLVCVAERELADAVLYGRTMFAVWEGDKAKGKPKKKRRTLVRLIPSPFLSFPDQVKPSILCMNRALYPLSV